MQFSFFSALGSILADSGFAAFLEDPRSLIMILISFVLLYLGIGKRFEPLLLIPACFLGGGAFCLFCDLIARTAFAPTEVSISSVTAVFGAPVVIYMMLHRKGAQ